MIGNFCIAAFVIGFMLGVVLRRGFFCFYNGLANVILSKDYRIIRATIWAFLFTMLSFHILATAGIITLNPKPFFWVGSVLGAIVFGIGMVLSGSCIVGTPLRAASGILGYWFTLLGMGVGGWLVIWGPLAGFRKNILQEATRISIGGKAATWDGLFKVNPWIVVLVLVAISVFLLVRLKMNEESADTNDGLSIFAKIIKGLWSPIVIGIALAMLETLAFLSGYSPAGLGGFIKGYATLFRAVFIWKLPWGWPVSEVVGILLGVFVAAVVAGEFRIVMPKWKQVPRLFFGGLLMGMGAVIAAGGCNVAHIISHMPQLSIGSFVSGFVIILTVWFVVSAVMKRSISSS